MAITPTWCSARGGRKAFRFPEFALPGPEQERTQAHPRHSAEGHAPREEEGCLSDNLAVPALRAVVRSFRLAFGQLAVPERVDLARRLLEANIDAQGYVGVELLALSTAELLPAYRERIDHVPDRFRGWGLTDHFCIRVLQPLLLQHPQIVLKLLDRWNRSENCWKRRASVVAFTRRVGASGRFTDECLRLCEALLHDREDLVRKGVGWALKDCLRGDKARVLGYVKELRRRGVSATMTLYAIRGLKGDERQRVLLHRARHSRLEPHPRA